MSSTRTCEFSAFLAGPPRPRHHISSMIEIIIERWTNSDASQDFLWSIWQGDQRVDMGGPHQSAEGAEEEAMDFCRGSLQSEPDKITRL